MDRTVVVGVDGSLGARAALEHALEDAVRRGVRLRVVAAVTPPEYLASPYGYSIGLPPFAAEREAQARGEAQRLVDDVVAACPADADLVPIDVVVTSGVPAEVLLEASQGADLLVLGHRGRGAFSSVVLGSVGLQCVLHAACPVTIVRPAAVPVTAEAVASGAIDAPVPV